MKNKFVKILIIFIVLACLVTPLFFLFPEKETTMQLETPVSCALTVLDNGTVQLSTQENQKANKYVFAICDSTINSSDANYFVKIESDSNVIDATEYFTGNKTYYYYAFYKGAGIFTNSEKTQTQTYVNSIQLETPSNFARQGTMLGWDAVSGSVSYTIFEGTTAIATQTTRTYDFGSLLQENRALNFQVRANGDNLHITSPKTSVVSYVVHVQLAIPTNLTISGTGASLKLTWNPVQNASTYTVKINNSKEVVATTNSLNLATYITELGPYSFKIKTNDNLNYVGSDYSSSSETYTKYQSLSAPTGLFAIKNSQFIEISWNSVKNATSYTIKINGVEYENITSTTYSINTTIILPNESLSYEIQVKAIATGYYKSSTYGTVYAYTGYTRFSSPTNVKVIKTNNVVIASWDAVANATSYSILIDNVQQLTSVTNSINLSTYCTLPQSYFIQVRVNNNASEMIIASPYTVNYEYKNMISISSPTNFSATSDGTNIVFNFDEPANALNYTIMANDFVVGNELTLVNNSIAINSLPASANGKYVFGIYANENGYYAQSATTQSNEYTLLSIPSNIYTERDDTKIYISWDNVQSATSYEIYINNAKIDSNIINYIDETHVEILLSNLITSSSYICKLIAISSTQNCLMSAFSEEITIEYNQKRATPTGLQINKANNSYTATWNAVNGATSYIVSLNNEKYTVATNSLVIDNYISNNKIYSIRVCADGINEASRSDYCVAIMLNTTQNFIANYSNKYFYLNGWHDFNIENDEELNEMILYFIYNQLPEIQYYSNYNTSVSNYDKFDIAFGTIAETRSITYYISDNTISKTLRIYNAQHKYKQGGANTTLKRTTTQMEEANYSLDTKLKTHNILTPTRTSDFNDFVIEKSLIEIQVETSNQLYKAIEGGAKPIIASTNTHLLNVYNTAKNVLRNIISNDMTEYEKAHAIFDWITDNCYYDYLTTESSPTNSGSYNCFYVEGVLLDRVAVCDGIAKTYAMLCGMEGIKCVKVGGKASGGDHAWNKIYLNIDGTYKWYAVDSTWSNLRVNFSGEQVDYRMMLTHSYFLLNDSEINVDHTAIGNNPPALGTKTYYELELYDGVNDLNITSTVELNNLATYLANNKKSLLKPNGIEGFEFKYYDTTNLNSDITTAFSSAGIGSYSKIVSGSTVIVLFN